MDDPSDQNRRDALRSTLALAVLAVAGPVGATPATTPASTTGTATPPRGKPGEFDFLTGEWRIQHRRLKDAASGAWDEFTGEATCWSILGGIASIEELRIPSRGFAGMGLRLLAAEDGVWRDHWMNAKSGVLAGEGVRGGFRDGVGVFESEELDGTTRVLARGTWDRITARSCRWQQTTSRDGGRTWVLDWSMDWTRA